MQTVALHHSGTSDTPESALEVDDRLYCICHKPYNAETDDDDMIECDRCDNWFHLLCVKITPAELDLIDMYICPNCEHGEQGRIRFALVSSEWQSSAETTERTTRKAKCRRDGCSFARFEPLSR